MEIEGLQHRTLAVNGIRMHVVEKGEGPVVLLLHGFPELWYSWRHQIPGLASRGYRAVAPDLRGFGGTDAPDSVLSYTAFHIVGDLVGLIDALGQDKVFVVGHDWGARVAWDLCMLRPDRVRALVNLNVPFRPRHPQWKPVEALRYHFGDDHYICRFQEPGAAEAAFSKIGSRAIIKKFLSHRHPDPVVIPKVTWFEGATDTDALPHWLSEEDVNYYASNFDKTGFTGGLNYYRAMDLNWELTAPWTGVQIKVPVKFIVGDLDLVYHIPGTQDYIHKGGFKKDVPLLEDVVVMEGVSHFVNQEKGPEITDHIYDFIKQF